MAGRRYLVLGPVEAHLDGRALPVAPGRQTQLLAALLARPNQVVAVDALVDALWGQRPPPGAAGTLRALGSKLRRALACDPAEPDLLIASAGGYRLRLPEDPQALDAGHFAALLARARHPRSRGNAADAVAAYRQALGLWRGPAFTGATGRPGLVNNEALRLDAERLAVTEECLLIELELGRHSQVLGELEALAAAEPLRERPHELLMLALYRSGRQHDALQVYTRLRTRLVNELGVEPSTAVRALHQRLLRQDPALEVCPPPPGPAAAGAEPGNLPVPRRGLIGRDDDLARIEQTLAVSPVTTLTGAAGVGKTRLAVHVAQQATHTARFPHGVWFV
jgi:DNA-binding SARP family transcriptional activator